MAAQEEKPAAPTPADRVVVTQGRITLNGADVPYTVTTGTFVLHEEDDEKGPKPKAEIFFVAYTRNDGQDPRTRPLTFSFNGGPGSSSVWLHLGLLGPRRIIGDEDGNLPQPPYHLTDNEYSLLDVSDLVFIDPVSTGYSRAVPGEKPDQFHQFTKDIETVAEFVRLYVTRTQRWGSPKFLIGESYGTTRASGLVDHLQQRHGMYFNGVMLVSSILEFQTARFDPGNDMPYLLFLPTYAATAWYHGCLAKDLQADLAKTLAEAEEFALGEYALALLQGAALPARRRQAVARKLARLTGLDAAYIERTDLRIEIFRFTKELLRACGRTVGRLDTRFLGFDRDTAGERMEFDPSYATIQGPYTATFNDYVRRELRFESDLPYEILTGRVAPWKYDKHENRYASVADNLRRAIAYNPHLKVIVANGYYDLATPYLATNYTFNHLGLPEDLRANIRMTYYEAGHMMYVHQPSLAQLKADLAAFVNDACPQG